MDRLDSKKMRICCRISARSIGVCVAYMRTSLLRRRKVETLSVHSIGSDLSHHAQEGILSSMGYTPRRSGRDSINRIELARYMKFKQGSTNYLVLR